jgi:hypothetical protein
MTILCSSSLPKLFPPLLVPLPRVAQLASSILGFSENSHRYQDDWASASTSDAIRLSALDIRYSPSLHLDDEPLPIPSFLPYLGSWDVDIGSDHLHRALRSYAHG